MQYFVFILTILFLSSCSEKSNVNNISEKQSLPLFNSYINNPKETDTLCINEIERAKKDLKQGFIVFTQSVGFGTGQLRYEKELNELCKTKGLVLGVDMIGCVIMRGQTQGCYGDYMDKIISEKFGDNFKQKLHIKADSLFLANCITQNKVVKYWDCDERPRLTSEKERTSDELPSIEVTDIDIIKDESDNGGWPFFDLNFVVELDSSINKFDYSNYVAELNQNEKYKDKLFKIAVSYLKNKYPVWVPGKIKGIPVRTSNNVRIHFEKNHK